ncbi:MAG: glycosyltransferase family 2 protein [Acidiphilium sp.]|nr:glycosyltransferase family 2 protein [Acidiphilium sp.]MDD4935326.1 glycosyltransferase family 2 protein [Acidiphilium sp.]
MIKKTTVIVLHYRGVEETIGCLRSVLPQCHATLDVLLVDNGSTDGVAEALAAEGIVVPHLRLSDNQGWAGGNNAGIQWARDGGADAVCLLNNDTVVPPGTFDHLADVVSRVGPCLLHPAIDFADPAEGAQLDPVLWGGAMPVAGYSSLYAMNYAYGACLMVPVAVFDRIGVFDERFFLQLEEADLYERALRAGISAFCDASVRIVHAESRTFGGRITPNKTYYIARNSLLLAEKNYFNGELVRFVLKRAYWHAAAVAAIGDKPTFAQTFRWLLSPNLHARAIRESIHDYVFRRFGPRRHNS